MKRNEFLGTEEPDEPPVHPFFAEKPAPVEPAKPKEEVKTLHLPRKK